MRLKFILGVRYSLSFTVLAFLSRSQGVDDEKCKLASGPLPIDGSLTTSSTTGQTLNASNSIKLSSCGASGQLVDIGTPGMWFLATGTGGRVMASTCSDVTNFEHRITVFRGEDCDSNFCLDTGRELDLECDSDFATSVEWDTTLDETYYILVHDLYTNSSGDFGLTLATKTPENDQCQTATDLEDMTRIKQTTVGALVDNEISECTGGSGGLTNPGVWYRVLEKDIDTRVFLSICAEALTFDVSVYSGDSCGEITCHAPIETANFTEVCQGGKATELSWIASVGQKNYIFVQASFQEGEDRPISGSFELQFLREEDASFDDVDGKNGTDAAIDSNSSEGYNYLMTIRWQFVLQAFVVTSLVFWS